MAIDRPLSTAPVGLFDSGVGGLSVWREVRQQWPAESTIYFADQAHIPYGPRPPTEILRYAEAITVHLLDLGCKAIVVACNAASAAALYALRARFPQTPFIGMEPAVKPAAKATQSRVVGVLATPGTLAGALFAQTAQRYAADVRLINQPCPGLVEQIEAGRLESPDTEALLRDLLAPMLDAGADRIVLACTHHTGQQGRLDWRPSKANRVGLTGKASKACKRNYFVVLGQGLAKESLCFPNSR